MRPVSKRFLETIPYSHKMVARARLCTPGQEGTNPGPIDPANGEPLYPLAIQDGDVFFDPAAQIRATAQLTALAAWPGSKFDMLNPYGAADLFIERGVEFGDGAREWVSQGYFRLDKLKQRQAPNGPILIDAPDRMAGIVDARLTQPRQYVAATTKRAVIEDLVQEIYPAATVTLTGFDADEPLGSDQICEQDRYSFLSDIAKAHGCTMYFDYDGTFVMKPISSYENTEKPVWTIAHGEGGVLIQLARELSRTNVFNAVVATGEQLTDAEPVQSIAYDLDPNSVTRWSGPFGQVPRFYNSSFLRTNDQARLAAIAMLARSIGVPYTVDFNIVPNPALEPLDLVGVSYSAQSGAERHVIDTLQVPLVARRSMTGTTRIRPRGVLE